MNDNIFSCFVSVGQISASASQEEYANAGSEFRKYIWGEKGIDRIIKELKHESYGEDIILVLLQFYIDPVPFLMERLKPIENYRKKEKAIGIPIIIDSEYFFSNSEEGRYELLKEIILQKLDLLFELVGNKKLDTNVPLLKLDVLQTKFKFHD